MSFKQAIVLSFCSLILPVSVLFSASWLVSRVDVSPHPSDESLLREFPSKEAQLNRLLKMSNEDAKVIRIGPDFTRLDDNWGWPRPESKLGFSAERWDDYRKLFNELELPVGIERSEPRDGIYVFFPVSTRGLGNGHGSSKGYAYLEKELPRVLDSLDEEPVKNFYQRERPEHEVTLFRRIKGNWYIYSD